MYKKNTFLGRGWSFPPVFNQDSKSVEMVEDEIDIYQSLVLILTTRPGERVTNPNFGCAMHDYLFHPIDSTTNFLIKDAIKRAILYFEPRITLHDVLIDTSEELDGIVGITLDFTIRKINVRSNIVFPFYKIEGTLVNEI
jgi:phage baseplate assembly protein W